jgi:hypothetical protein
MEVWSSIDMELFLNEEPTFTQFVVESGLLESEFTVLDVGVLGGANPRWDYLGDYLTVHGLDAVQENIDELQPRKRPGRTYHCMAIGDNDTEADFYGSSTSQVDLRILGSGAPSR